MSTLFSVALFSLVALVTLGVVSPASAAAEARAVVNGFEGFTLRNEPEGALETVPGPLAGTTGVRAADGSATFHIESEIEVTSRGSFALWLWVDQAYLGGMEDRIGQFREFMINGPLNLEVGSYDNMLSLRFLWDGPNVGEVLPQTPGPGWYHLAYEWDADRGIFNAYLNGTPMRPRDLVASPWALSPIDSLEIVLERFAISGVRLSDRMLGDDKLRELVTPGYLHSVDYMLGGREPAPYVIEQKKGELLYENELRREADVEDWVMEGPGKMSFDDGWLRMKSEAPDAGGHFVVWCPFETPENYIVEWDFQVLRPHLSIVFFSATGPDGKSALDPSLEEREGLFRRYIRGEIDAYHISYYAHNRLTTNLRKNHGFYLPAVGPHPIPYDSRQIHTVQLMKNGGHIQLAIDGNVAIDFRDDGETYGPIFGGGHIGLRHMQRLDARYRDFRIYEVQPRHQPRAEDLPPMGRMPRAEEVPPRSVIERLGPNATLVDSIRLPVEGWRFHTDPERRGRDEQWYAPDLDDAAWDPIPIDHVWQDAGYDYVGVGWYRRDVDVLLEREAKGRSAVLAFGGVDESAWVWVNGEFAGERDIGPAGWDRPFMIDVTDQIKWGEVNQITVRARNTAGLGGIYEPIDLYLYKAGDE